MSIPVLLSLALLAPTAPPSSMSSPPCRPQQLRIVPDGRDGDFNGMSHSGTALSIRNTGRDCTIAALPRIELRDARNRALPAMRQPPVGMHPGPVMVPVRIAGGHRAVTTLRWVSGPVFPHSRSLRVTRAVVQIGAGSITVPLTAVLYGEAGKPVTFDQTPLRPVEGMAAG